ncbi:hypothetical protein AA0473_2164 [Acetobacter orleanensis NRIC 0473]|uniref:Uncharacterized protein n=1 Tax=Acetobacter orleanensis TaxID=104099 RepID=A0A4Y3TQL0_9PROT|nr:hypothetical protein CO710_12625 [Acetobacter orleanensis]GAN69510.1 hypothetical protein Abol_039_015 [Acetobacter orleanensis JCM 7639]GBR30033.1 hypothetical protein AA0473_2164 [Acetobacter orleanensis NRIC 0473]GEB84023.1 hypothetical protein AOR01nite_25000 [Acetobacter orleanensis]
MIVADYHHAKSSTDEIFQRGLTAALEAGTEAWAGQKNSSTEIEHKTMAVLDAGILHWFRLTGRKIAGN